MLDFFKKAFSEGVPDYEPSSSRLVSAICAIAVIGWGTHVAIHTHALPDPASMAAATAFSTAHYVANRVTNAFGKQ